MGTCLTMDQLANLAEGNGPSTQRTHLRHCPRCRAMLASYRQFTADDPDQAEPGRMQRLDQALHTEIFGVPRHSQPTEEKGVLARIRRELSWPRSLMAAASIVLLVSLIEDLPRPQPQPGPIIQRNAESAAVFNFEPRERLSTDGCTVTLTWRHHPEATSYTIRIYGSDLTMLDRVELGDTTTFTPAPASLNDWYHRSKVLLWRVDAFAETAPLVSSDPRPLPATSTRKN